MSIARALSALFLLLSLYYLWFFGLRQDPLTVVQMVALLCAAGFLFLQERPHRPTALWFRGWRPVAWQAWATVLFGVGLALVVFVVLDRNSHSVSDTLHRIVPTYSLLAALAVKVWYERSGSVVR